MVIASGSECPLWSWPLSGQLGRLRPYRRIGGPAQMGRGAQLDRLAGTQVRAVVRADPGTYMGRAAVAGPVVGPLVPAGSVRLLDWAQPKRVSLGYWGRHCVSIPVR